MEIEPDCIFAEAECIFFIGNFLFTDIFFIGFCFLNLEKESDLATFFMPPLEVLEATGGCVSNSRVIKLLLEGAWKPIRDTVWDYTTEIAWL